MKKHRIYLENTYPDREQLKQLPHVKYDGKQKQWWIPSDVDKMPFRKWLPEMARIKIFLNVPLDDASEAAAKAAGAMYDTRYEGFFVIENEVNDTLKKWLPRMYQKDASKPYLSINMIPATSYGKNLHSLFLTEDMWAALSRNIRRRAGNRCEICGDHSTKHPVECNEHWTYSHTHEFGNVQKLERLEALCRECHSAVHYGRTFGAGSLKRALKQLRLVNDWDHYACEIHANEAEEIWRERSQYEWAFDLSLLHEFGIHTLPLTTQRKQNPEVHVLGIETEGLPKQRRENRPALIYSSIEINVSASAHHVSPGKLGNLSPNVSRKYGYPPSPSPSPKPFHDYRRTSKFQRWRYLLRAYGFNISGFLFMLFMIGLLIWVWSKALS